MKKILIVGANSKISNEFIDTYVNRYKFYNTFKNKADLIHYKKNNSQNYILDLNSIGSIRMFLQKVKKEYFSGVLLFSSIYKKDNFDDIGGMLENLNVNIINIIYLIDKLIKNGNIVKQSKIIFFKDAGTKQPKCGYISYSIAKNIIGDILPSLSVKYNNIIFLGIDMGPVYTDKIGGEKDIFYSKSLIKLDNPLSGLINFLNFLINEANFFSTGSIIDFSGGTYLIRNNQKCGET
ncbi:MAG TPA: hypothetical protein PK674_01225 [Candidatus Absconditabacterales bacterium]|nr:hypothetical protein [Candidatus Absconditabacterales bacterium]HOQ78770.1 hypothetical protein [Candidatus Absconditabacterales bacterium]HPK27883.1 hypothetical protein [Candidatus Absconditabacterales bacterium]